MSQQKSETEEDKKLERAVDLILNIKSQIDLFMMGRAIITILERRARKPAWQEWFCNKFQDAERLPEDCMRPLEPDIRQ